MTAYSDDSIWGLIFCTKYNAALAKYRAGLQSVDGLRLDLHGGVFKRLSDAIANDGAAADGLQALRKAADNDTLDLDNVMRTMEYLGSAIRHSSGFAYNNAVEISLFRPRAVEEFYAMRKQVEERFARSAGQSGERPTIQDLGITPTSCGAE